MAGGMSDLTERERMLAVMVRCGLKNREIAEKIGIRPEVVRNYLRLIYRKLGITGGVGTKRVKLAVMVVEERKRNGAKGRAAGGGTGGD